MITGWGESPWEPKSDETLVTTFEEVSCSFSGRAEQKGSDCPVHPPWKTIALLFLSKEDLTRCVGGGRIINVTRWEEKLSRFWSKLSSVLLDSTATRASLCTVPQSKQSRVLVTYETISNKIKLNFEIKKVLRLELAKFGVHVVTIQPGDFSKATHLLHRWSSNIPYPGDVFSPNPDRDKRSMNEYSHKRQKEQKEKKDTVQMCGGKKIQLTFPLPTLTTTNH